MDRGLSFRKVWNFPTDLLQAGSHRKNHRFLTDLFLVSTFYFTRLQLSFTIHQFFLAVTYASHRHQELPKSPLVHASLRNRIWRQRNLWFGETGVPQLRSIVKEFIRTLGISLDIWASEKRSDFAFVLFPKIKITSFLLYHFYDFGNTERWGCLCPRGGSLERESARPRLLRVMPRVSFSGSFAQGNLEKQCSAPNGCLHGVSHGSG